MSPVSCSKCKNKKGIYFRPYSGETLCKSCFIISIEEKTSRTISKFSMVSYDDKIAVGVSGGKDSLSLLYILKEITSRKNICKLVAITIDEGIMGYRDESLKLVKDFCAKLNIKNEIFSYKDIFGVNMDDAISSRPSKKMTSCSICGTFRRRAIDIAAQNVSANIIATGHNLDDQLQSFLINIISGDVNRIGWLNPEPVSYHFNGMKKIKPFIEIYEKEIVFYALQQNIPFQTEQCPYMNEGIRTDLRNFFNLLEEQRPGIKYNTYSSLLKISKISKLHTDTKHNKCGRCGHESNQSICSVCKNLIILQSN
ncbi:MAG: TIGR00269 family protein [Nitrososphaeraceae archaeon]|nr:TIGR00269 family protein [Nitrososphaeraceae archaeon]